MVTTTPEEFIEKLKQPALKMEAKCGVPAPVIIAQAALETGWGRHMPTGSNNLFGIKNHRWEDESVTADTKEYIDGEWVDIEAEFRRYDSWEASIEDHSRFLLSNNRYDPCFEHTDDPKRFALELQKAGYATDPMYAEKLISIMERWGLLEIEAERGKQHERGDIPMVGTIKSIFSTIQDVLGVVALVITLVELDPDCEESEEKLEKAKKWLEERLDDLEERGTLPRWARKVFFSDKFCEWLISVLVSLAHRVGFFSRAAE